MKAQDEKSCHSLCIFLAKHRAPHCASTRKTPMEVVLHQPLSRTSLLSPRHTSSLCAVPSLISQKTFAYVLQLLFPNPLLQNWKESNKNGPNCCSTFSWVANTTEYQAENSFPHRLPCIAPAPPTLFLHSLEAGVAGSPQSLHWVWLGWRWDAKLTNGIWYLIFFMFQTWACSRQATHFRGRGVGHIGLTWRW